MPFKSLLLFCALTVLFSTTAAATSSSDGGILLTAHSQVATAVPRIPPSYSPRSHCRLQDLRSDEIIIGLTYSNLVCGPVSSTTYWYFKVSEAPKTSAGYIGMCLGDASSDGYATPDGYIFVELQINSQWSCPQNRVKVIIENDPPVVAQDYSFSIPRGVSLRWQRIDFSQGDNDRVSLSLNPAPASGAAVYEVSKSSQHFSFDYVPPAHWYGTETFGIRIDDGRHGVATVMITMTVSEEYNQAPRFSSDHLTHIFDVNQDSYMVYGNISDDPDGDDVLINHTFEPNASNGTNVKAGDLPEDYFIYTPNPGFYGQDRALVHATDWHGLTGSFEIVFNVIPTDQDRDGLPDTWELSVGLDPTNPADATADSDQDGLDNLAEYANQTAPFNGDTDGDLIDDGYEVASTVLSPTNSADALEDSDGDGYNNYQEYLEGSDPNDPSSTPLNVSALSVILNQLLF